MSRTRLSGVLLVVCIVSFESSSSWAQDELTAQAYVRLSKVTVKIICNDGTKEGSGSIIGIANDRRAVILTACHVIATNFRETDEDIALKFCKRISVKIAGELQPVQAKVLSSFVDRANDLALIATTSSILEDDVISYTRSDKVKREQGVKALGFPGTYELTQTAGKIIRLDPKYLIFDANIDMGSSGGPLVDNDGRMVGLSTALVKVEGKIEGYAIPVDVVASVVNVWLSRIKLKKKWEFKKDVPFFKKPIFISGTALVFGLTVGGIWLLPPDDEPQGFPLPPGRPNGN